MSRSRKKNPYRKSRRFDRTCRSNGGCPYCRSNRMHKHRKREESTLDQLRDAFSNINPSIAAGVTPLADGRSVFWEIYPSSEAAITAALGMEKGEDGKNTSNR